uniref:Uncharacterized protein n=1 Tax=Arundo donax TaxID=35708 RepID=A0A0A9EKT8_ARUDO
MLIVCFGMNIFGTIFLKYHAEELSLAQLVHTPTTYIQLCLAQIWVLFFLLMQRFIFLLVILVFKNITLTMELMYVCNFFIKFIVQTTNFHS